ncbi:hypothetical protein COU53_00945 [Candidatus Pacearchaeota archaeon CG10_big_fil_rev_8_21_14_0_10_30_48]|nr:MAG: hypothetical protein COU53_00945 [Candidatus Pacearchaeota archaeon CG10_big_fil_rev_8_21_14_0_10_30_48]
MSLNSFFLSIIIYELKAHFYVLALIGSIISNNLFVIFLSSLSGQGLFSLWKVWIIALMGVLISDIIWFTLGKSASINKIARHRHFLYNYYSIKSILNKSGEKNNFFVFLGSKFVYGAKIITLMYAGRRNMRIKDFIRYNVTSSTIWVSFLVFLGFLAGKGFTKLLDGLNNLKYALVIFILIIIIIYFLWFLSGRIVMNGWKKMNKKIDKKFGHKIIVTKFKYQKFMNRFN